MSNTLLIHYNPVNPEQTSWALCNEQGELTTKIRCGSLADITDIAPTHYTAAHHTVLLLNSTCLHINSVSLPTQNMQKMLRAVPYALEDFIAEDVDDFHFVIVADKQNANTAVVGIKKQTLQAIIEDFNDAGLVIDSIIPDALCLAADNKQWVILNHEDNCYFQSGRYYGAIFSTELIPYILQKNLTRDEVKNLEKLLIFSPDDTQDTEQTNSLLQNISPIISQYNRQNENSQEIEILPIRYNTHPLVVFCGLYKQALALNLLQGNFKTRRKNNGNWQYWRLTATFAAVWLVLHLSLTAFQLTQLKHKNLATHNLIRQTYKTTFPASKRIVDPRVQMEQKLKAMKNSGNSQNGLLFLLAKSFGTVTTNKPAITLQSINYRNKRMDIGLDSTNLQAIENLNKQLNANPEIKAEIISSSADKNRVKGNLRIEAGS